MTGMLIAGKISIGMRVAANTLSRQVRLTSDATLYGRRNANRTRDMSLAPGAQKPPQAPSGKCRSEARGHAIGRRERSTSVSAPLTFQDHAPPLTFGWRCVEMRERNKK